MPLASTSKKAGGRGNGSSTPKRGDGSAAATKADGKDGCTMEGQMEKKTSNMLLRVWQPRWVSLASTGLSYWKVKDGKRDGEKKTISLGEVRQCVAVGACEMEVTGGGRTLQFKAPSSKKRDDWVAAVLTAVKGMRAADYSEYSGGQGCEHWQERLEPCLWGGVKTDFALGKVFKDTPEWKEVASRVKESLPEDFVVRIVRVQNRRLLTEWQKYRRCLEKDLEDDGSKHKVRSWWGFHGCKCASNARGISEFGFDPVGSGQFGAGGGGMAQYGKGCYFAREAQVALRYGGALDDAMAKGIAKNGERLVGEMFVWLSEISVGDWTVGNEDDKVPPPCLDSSIGRRHDSLVDNTSNPGVMVSLHSAQAYPSYIILLSRAK